MDRIALTLEHGLPAQAGEEATQMSIQFERDTMSCEVLTSDGNWTIGYVDGRAAQWEGNMHTLNDDDDFYWMNPSATFGVQYTDEYRITVDCRWDETSETS